MLDTEWYERPAATGETQRIPAQSLAARAPSPDYTQYIPVAIAGLVAYIALSAFGVVGNNDRAIQLAPPAPQITYHIEDNSWNMCGLCYSPNVSPHITIETRP